MKPSHLQASSRLLRTTTILAGISLSISISACSDAPREKTAHSRSQVGNGSAGSSGCRQVINPNDGSVWGIEVCDDERGKFASTVDRFGVMAVGLPKTNPWQGANGDWYQTFERVEMNSNFGEGCQEGRACIAHLGRWDIESNIGRSIADTPVSCDSPSFAQRSEECLPSDFKEKYAKDGGLEFYGHMLTPVTNCVLYPNDEQGECFWTERAKVGRRTGETWVGELLGNKKIELEFERALATVEEDYANCAKCTDLAGKAPPRNGDPVSAGIGAGASAGGGVSAARVRLDRKKICEALEPIKALGNVSTNVFMVVGAQLMGGAGVTGQVGVEQVWDFGHQHVASFLYAGGGLGATIASASAYMGYALDYGPSMRQPAKANVIDAWKGAARSLGASVGLLQPWVQGGITGFASEDWTIRGLVGSLSLAITFDLGVPVPDLQENWYTPNDTLTEAYANNYWYLPKKGVENRSGAKVVQFDGTIPFALGVLAALGPNAGPPAATLATAVGALRSMQTTAMQLCP